jgi:hypothetical protein
MKFARNILYLAAPFVIFLAVLELLFRSVVFLVEGAEMDRNIVRPAPELGWVHNVRMKKQERKNKCGETVVLLPSPHRVINKFPEYSEGKKIVFTGDSFTHAHEVSSGKAYYDVFEENTRNLFSVYAAGIGGFGNWQEYLALESVFDEVKPEIVVWQLCGNDVENNVFELDNASLFNNQMPRPYLNLQKGRTEMKNPGFWLFDVSHGFRFVFKRFHMLDWKYRIGVFDLLNSALALDPLARKKYERQGLDVLDRALYKVKTRFSGTRVYGFSVDGAYDEEFRKIFEKYGAVYFKEFYKGVNRVQGTNCFPLDGHWNHLGNKVAGDLLTELISMREK